MFFLCILHRKMDFKSKFPHIGVKSKLFPWNYITFDDFPLFSNEIPTVGTKGNVMISREILENRPPRIEIDLSRSSRGVQKCSWALQIVIRVCWTDCARFWDRRSDPNTISRSTIFFFVKISHTPGF